MKNLTLLFLVCSISLILAGCASSPDQERQDPNFIGDYDAIELEMVMLNKVDQGSAKFTPKEVAFSFFPQTNIMHMYVKYDMNSVSVYLDETARGTFKKALESYVDEFKKGELTKKKSQQKAYFGSSPVYMQWGLLAPNYLAQPKLRFEYLFDRENKPYFIAANATAPEIDDKGKDKKNGNGSPAIKLAISPVQATRLVKLLEQDYLVGLVREKDAESKEFDLPPEEAAPSDTTEYSTEAF